MNLQRPNSSDATRTANRSKSVVPMSGTMNNDRLIRFEEVLDECRA